MIRVARTRGVKKRSHEKLSDSNIKHVMQLLDAESPITKKEACSILNISYNTTRLKTIIEEYVENKEYREKRKAANRGKPASNGEITSIIESFISGTPISDISRFMYRSPAFIKNIVERVGVPRKRTKEERGGGYTPFYLPEECVSESFEVGETVWAAQYDQAAIIQKEETTIDYEAKYGAKCYNIYVFELIEWSSDMLVSGWIGERMGGFYSTQIAYDLGSLKHLEAYGVNLMKLQG